MANVLGRSENVREYAAKGLASIRCGTDHVQITFLGKNKQGKEIVWDTGETSKRFHKDDLPSTFVFEPRTEGEYYVCTTFDKSEVYAIGPWEGTFDMQVHDFSRPEKDADPHPYNVEGKDGETGREYHYQEFKVFWKIVEKGSEFKNCIVVQKQRYHSDPETGGGSKAGFESDENGYTRWAGQITEKSKWQPRLEKFCERHDAVSTPIPWPDDGNILPELFLRVTKAPVKIHRMKVEKGEVADYAETAGRRRIVEENPYEVEGDEPLAEKELDVDKEFPKNGKHAQEAKRPAKELVKELGYDDPAVAEIKKTKRVPRKSSNEDDSL